MTTLPKLLPAVAMSALLSLTGCGPAKQTETSAPQAEEMVAKPGISVQLWSVKDDLKADFKGTLQALADMGFDGVEFAGDFGPYKDDPAGLKDFLNGMGMQASGAHIPFSALKEHFDDTVKFYKTLGVSVLIVPWDDRAFTGDQVKDTVADLTQFSKKLADEGMQIGFHNHAQEWADYQNTTYFEYLADNTPDGVVLQQDVGWTLHASKDPVKFVKANPGRILTTHFKSDVENQPGAKPIIGQDDIDWATIYAATANEGGADWIVLEQEEYPDGMSQLEAVAATKKGFDAVLAAM